jgi:hypothetical protein
MSLIFTPTNPVQSMTYVSPATALNLNNANPLNQQLLITSDNTMILTPDTPIAYISTWYPTAYGLPDNLNLNNNSEIKSQITRTFWYKVLDKWLYDDLLDILAYITVDSSGKVDLIKNIADYKSSSTDSDTLETIEKKTDFIERYFLREDEMYQILKRLVQETGINWIDLVKNSYYVKASVKHYLKKKIKKAIEMKRA